MAEPTTHPGSRAAQAGAGHLASSLRSGLDKMLIQVKVRNRLRPAIPHESDEVVPDATIALIGLNVGDESIPAGALANKAVTNRKGEAILDLGAMIEGTFTLTVESKYNTAEDASPWFVAGTGRRSSLPPFDADGDSFPGRRKPRTGLCGLGGERSSPGDERWPSPDRSPAGLDEHRTRQP